MQQLNRFRIAKKAEIENLQILAEQNKLPQAFAGTRCNFLQNLRQHSPNCPLAVIAEYKRASPSKGIICESLDVTEVAKQYSQAGAKAMSILTESEYFHGKLDYIDTASLALENLANTKSANANLAQSANLPILRKDFIFDPLQVIATASTRAAAMLLIVRLTPDLKILRDLREKAESYGIEAVVEIFNNEDLQLARDSGAKIIQVNARDLETFQIDRQAGLKLLKDNQAKEHEFWIAASGISEPQHLVEAADAGYHAVLIGSALMSGGQPGKALENLLQGTN